MSRCNVLVVSAEPTLAWWLVCHLDQDQYGVVAAKPGPQLIELARQARPRIAVLDAIDTRPHAAQLEVAVLKDQCPGVRVIALSTDSSDQDGDVIEQGVFCYLAGCSHEELHRVIEAAARDAHRPADAKPTRPMQPRSVS